MSDPFFNCRDELLDMLDADPRTTAVQKRIGNFLIRKMNRRRGVVWWPVEARREGGPDLVKALGVDRASIQRAINGDKSKGRPGLIELGYLERANAGKGGRARANEFRFGWLASSEKGRTSAAVSEPERAAQNTPKGRTEHLKGPHWCGPNLENLENPSERETETSRDDVARSRAAEGRAARTPTEKAENEPGRITEDAPPRSESTAEQRRAVVAKLWRAVEPGRTERPQWPDLLAQPADMGAASAPPPRLNEAETLAALEAERAAKKPKKSKIRSR